VVTQMDRTKLVQLEMDVSAQVSRLAGDLQQTQKKFLKFEMQKKFLGGGVDTGDTIGMLDSVVQGGMLRQLVQQAVHEDSKAASRARSKIVEFLKCGAGVLPRTADEMSKALALEVGGEDNASATDSSGDEFSFIDPGQIRRIAAAANGLDVAMRWIERLKELATGMRRGSMSKGFTLDLSQDASVFLGGSCGSTTWRKQVVRPIFDEAGISYYDPQKADWTPALVPLEAKAKEECKILLFVIDDATRSLVSVLEAVEHVCRGRRTYIVMKDKIDCTRDFDGTGVTASEGEIADLNRLRRYLQDVAVRHGVDIYQNIEDAARDIAIAHSIGAGADADADAKAAVEAP